jgi:imidazolonepropionase-like amidohydrolase
LTVTEIYDTYNDFLPTKATERSSGLKDGMANATRLAHEAGNLIGCGTDLIGPDQQDYGLEVGLVSDVAGPMRAIRTATPDNAKVLHIDDSTRSVENNKLADLVMIDKDLLDDPRILNDTSRVALVMKAGSVEKTTLKRSER